MNIWLSFSFETRHIASHLEVAFCREMWIAWKMQYFIGSPAVLLFRKISICPRTYLVEKDKMLSICICVLLWWLLEILFFFFFYCFCVNMLLSNNKINWKKIVKVTYLCIYIERYAFCQFMLNLICYLRVIGLSNPYIILGITDLILAWHVRPKL